MEKPEKRKIVCANCGKEFLSVDDYEAHWDQCPSPFVPTNENDEANQISQESLQVIKTGIVKEKPKKNGLLMFAITDNQYFALIIGWIIVPFLTGLLFAAICPYLIFVSITLAIVWGVSLAYFNRKVSAAGEM